MLFKGFYVVVGNFNFYDFVDMRFKDSMFVCYMDFVFFEMDFVILVYYSNGMFVR